MAKQLNVDLRFNADTQAAKRSINQLATELEKLSKPHKIEGISSESLKAASKAAQELQGHLQNAVNVNTGKLDLSKFSQSLSRSNTDIQSLALNLSRAGSQGQQAFASLVRNINMADKSMVGLGAKMTDFATTLKNTARWQISSSILHGFMGTISSALGYAERLNTSLNNIRIVTGQSVDQMAAFAEKANAAAKALSTTTTAYTDAALIYYQQGLTGKAVEERAEVTLKLANVSRQSAETVSQQMTGIWNNFYDGSKSLESYADVLTKLGATTASSTQEIATGLEKFAAIADTVGLSYEHAAAALATITATTRQSADIVGTALKTLFARIQDLEVGKTLDDGTTLGKYSQALAAIGVQIKDANGEVRSMDDILDDMGSKWDTLSKDMQIAVAQTVAGTRQYTQLMALMDNWDFMQQNLATARGAEGELQRQADVYAESWEAAQKRVRASAESLYSDLLNDKFFIGMNNGLAGFLNLIDNVIDGFGGLKTIIMGVGSIFMAKFAKEIPTALQNLRTNLDVITGQAAKNQQQMYKSIESVGQQMMRSPSAETAAQGRTMELTAKMSAQLQANLSSLSKAEQAEAQSKIKQVQAAGEYAAALGKEIDLLQQENNLVANQSFLKRSGQDNALLKEAQATEVHAAQREVIQAKMRQSYAGKTSGINSEEYKTATAEVEKYEAALRKAYDAYRQVAAAPDVFQKQANNFAKATQEVSRLQEKANQAKAGFEELKTAITATSESQQSGSRTGTAVAADYKAQAESIKVFTEYLQEASGAGTQFTEKTSLITEKLADFTGKEANAAEILRSFIDEILALTETEADVTNAIDKATEAMLRQRNALSKKMDTKDVQKIEDNARHQGQLKAQQEMAAPTVDFNKFAQHTQKMGESVGKFAGQLMNLGMAISSIKQLGSIWSNEDLSMGEKLTQSISSVSIVLMSASAMMKAFDISLLGAAASAKVAAGATLTFGETLAGLAAGPLGILLLAVAGIALIGTAIKEASKAIHEASPEGQLEKAEEQSQALSDALSDAKSAADALASAFDAYNEVQNKLAGCVEGTREWAAALQEANAATAALLQDYPELLDYVKTDSNGHTYVTQEGMDIATQRRQDAVTAATIADTSGKQRVKDAQLVVDNQDLAKKMAGGDADLREFIAHHMDEVAKIVANTDAKQVENQLNDLFKRETGGRWGRVTADQINTAVKQQGLQDELSQRVQASHLNDELAQTTNRLNAQSALANNQDIQNSKFKDDITNAIAQGMDQVQKEAAQERRKEFDKDAAREYLSNIKGVNLDNVSGLKIKGDSITYHDNEEDKDITVNKEVAIQGLAAADALSNVASSASDLKAAFEHLDKLSRADVEGARGAAAMLANGNMESLNQRDAAQMMSDLAKAGQTPTHYLENLFGGEDELLAAAKAAGYDSAKEFVDAFTEEAQNINKAWQNIKIPEGLQDGNLLGLGAAKQLQETFEMIKTNVGSNSAADFINQINDALSDLDPETKAEALNRIASIDFTSSDAMSQMASIILELGGNLDATSMAWQHFIDMMQQAGNCKPSFQDVINDLINLRSVLKDVDFGSVVDADTMAQIAQLSPALQDAFIQTADGYAFLGDQKQLQDAMTEGLMRQAAAYQEAGQRAENYKQQLEDSGLGNIFRDSLASEESKDTMWGGVNSTGDAKIKAIEMMQGVEGGQQVLEDALGPETVANLQEVLSTAEGVDSVYSRINEHLNTGSELLQDQQEKLASQATTVEQLNMLSSMGVGDDIYAKQAGLLIGTAEDSSQALSFLNDLTIGLENLPVGTIEALGEKFHNARDEALALKEAMSSGADADTLANLGDDLQNAISGANLADKYGMDASVVEDMVDSYQDLYDSISDGTVLLENNANSAQDAAERYIRLNNAVDDLVDNSDDYVDVLDEIAKSNKLAAGAARDSSKSMISASDGYKRFKTTLADLLDTSEDFVDMDLMEKLDPKDIAAAASGSEEAIGRIRDAFIDLQGEALDVDLSPLKEQLASMQDGEAMDLTFTVDGDTEPLMQKLLDAAVQSGMTAAEIEDMFAGMGIDCDVTPLEGSLTEAQQAAVDAGDAIVSNLGIEATDTSEEVQHEETEEMTGQTVVTTPTPANFTASAASINYSTSAVDTGEDGPKVMNATANITPVHAFIAGQTVPSVHVTPETETVTSEKTTVAPGMMVSNAKKSAGGKVNKGGGGRGGGGRRGGGGGRRCFVAGTLVSTLYGYVPIEQLRVGDTVLSYNEKLQKNEYSQVLQIMIHDTIELFYTLHIEDEIITSTGTHPFYIIRNGYGDWIEVQDVNVNDLVMFADGTLHKIIDIDIDIKATRVYNLEVSGNHNYYVGTNQILVHNKGGGRRRGGGGGGRTMTAAQSAQTANDIERYHVVGKQLESVSHGYNLLEKARNRTFGAQSIKNLKEEIKLMQKEIDLQKQYYQENRRYINSDKFNLVLGTQKQWTEQIDAAGNTRVKSGYTGGLVDLIAFASRQYKTGNAASQGSSKFKEFYNILTKNLSASLVQQISADASSSGYISDATGQKLKTYLQTHEDEMFNIANSILGYKDNSGVALNWKELQEEYLAELNRAEADYNARILTYQGASDTEENKWEVKQLEQAKERVQTERDEFQTLIDQLEESVALQKEIQEQYEDFIDSLQEINLALVREFTEQRQTYLDHMRTITDQTMSKIEDDFTKIPELMAMYYDKDNPNSIWSSIEREGSLWYSDWMQAKELLNKNVFDGSGHLTWVSTSDKVLDRNGNEIDLEKLGYGDTTNLGISDRIYMESLAEYFEKYSDKISELIDLDKQIGTYYLSALQGAAEYMNKLFSRLDRTLELNDHYKNLIGLMGKNFASGNGMYDYQKYMDKYYDTQSKLLKSNMAAEQKRYAMLKDQYNQVKEEYNSANDSYKVALDQYNQLQSEQNKIALDAAEARKKDYENMIFDLEEQVNESQDRIFENAAAQIENAQEQCEAAIEEIFRKAENSDILTNGLGWDALSTSIDLATQHADNYLTKYRQMYETTTFLNKIQTDMDKTTNQAAKTKLQDFSKLIENMQKQGELSVWELETAKARYEQLKAQIALEEAQDAKAIVRLQRDSEGNYGYVYTADQDSIDEAKQNLLDATNNIYELEEGYKDEAIQAIANLESEWFAATQSLVDMYYNGEIDHEEYSKRLADINEHYHQLILDQQAKFNFSSEILDNEFNEGRMDTWSGTYNFLVDNIKNAGELIRQTATDSEIRIKALDAVREEIFNNTDLGMQNLDQTLNDLISTNADYAKEIKEDVIPAMKDLLQRTLDQTKAIENQREQLKELIAEYEKYQKWITNKENFMTTKYDENINYASDILELLQANGYDFSDPKIQQLLLERQAKHEQTGKGEDNSDWIAKMLSNYIYENGLDSTDWKNGNGIVTNIATGLSKWNAQYSPGSTTDVQQLINQGYENAWGTGYDNENPTFERTNVLGGDYGVDTAYHGDYSAALDAFWAWAAGSGRLWNEQMVKLFGELNPNLIAKIAGRNDKIAKQIKEGINEYPVESIKEMLVKRGIYLKDPKDQAQWTDMILWAMDWIGKAGYGGTNSNWTPTMFNSVGLLKYMWEQRQNKARSSASGTEAAKYKEQTLDDWLRSQGYTGFASGGFTGVWGSDGKLAILHEKELVLNKEDTENILDAVAMIRELSNAIDLRALSYAVGGGILSPSIGNNSQTIEQQVTIQASFPNATDHNEIEQAFTTLINRATQYAGVPID